MKVRRWIKIVGVTVMTAGLAAPVLATFVLEWGTYGTAEGEFDGPRGTAVDSTGNVYVADQFNHRVQKFDAAGGFIEMWGFGVQDGSSLYQVCTSSCQAGLWGGGEGQFDQPADVTVDTAGNVYVADGNNSRVQKFNSSGTFLAKWGGWGDAEGRFRVLSGVAVDASFNVYVAGNDSHRIQKFDSAGNFLRMWGSGVQDGSTTFQICTSDCQTGVPGSGDGQVERPFDVAVDGLGNVYVADLDNHRIQKFDQSGNFLDKWGSFGFGVGELNYPSSLTTDPAGNLYVLEASSARIQKFDTSGTPLAVWGSWGTGPGEFQQPLGIAFVAPWFVYVADGVNDRVQKISVLLPDASVEIDIMPGSSRNPINMKGKRTGVIPVAILTTAEFDAAIVDVLSVRFAGAGAAHPHIIRGHVEDVDGDGDLDMLLHFHRDETSIACGDTSALLTGQATAGAFEASDSIYTVGCR